MSLFLSQLRGELRKLFARKRTFIGFGIFLGFEIVIFFLFRLPSVQTWISRQIEKSGYDPAAYMSGLTFGLLIVVIAVLLLEGLFLALVAGDIVSKEVEDGTLRMMLCRPISRGRILTLKIIVSCIYTFALTAFVMITALGVGFLNGGFGGLFVMDPLNRLFVFHDFWSGLVRYLLAIPLLSLSLCTITALAACLSCFNMKPAAATIISLAILFADTILKNVPYFESIRSWFITEKIMVWIQVFQYRVPWELMVEEYAWLMAINISLLVIAWSVFSRRDFKS